MLSISHRLKKNVCLIYIEGNITREVSQQLADYCQPFLLDEHLPGIVINLEKSPYMDSHGVSTLVSLFKQLQKRNASLILCHLNQKFLQVLTNIGLSDIFKICKTEKEALHHIMIEKAIAKPKAIKI